MNMQEIDMKILSEVVQSEHGISDSYIAEKLRLDLERVGDHFVMLKKDGFVELIRTFDGRYSAYPTSEGRLMIKEPGYMLRRLTGPMMIQVLKEAVEKDEGIPKPEKKSITDMLDDLKDNQYVSGLSTAAIFEIAKTLIGFS